MALDDDAALIAEAPRQLGQRADESEVFEQFRPQLLRDPPHLLERAADGGLCLLNALTSTCAIGGGERVELEQDAGQYLADLVVEVARDPQSLRLLGCQCAAAALATLSLQSVEHLIEGGDRLGHLGAALLDQSLPGLQQVDRSHPLDQPLDGRQRPSQQQKVGDEHRDQADDEVERLDNRERRMNGPRGQHKHERADQQQPRVDREDAPDQR